MNIDLKKYLNNYNDLISSDSIEDKLLIVKDLVIKTSTNKKNIYVFGNGGSAAIADHFAVDMTKNARINTKTVNTAAMITCLANDYGYEHWMKKSLEFYAKEGDIVFLISSSGSSMNVLNAANYAKNNGIKVITFSGFNPNNPLRESGDINFWVNSKAYNIVENIHQIWILSIVDLIIGKSEYSAS
jgi:D-sedoheptulose 7-phosphate isomerase